MVRSTKLLFHHEGFLDDLKLVEELVVNSFEGLGLGAELVVRSLQHLELLEGFFRLRLLGDENLAGAAIEAAFVCWNQVTSGT